MSNLTNGITERLTEWLDSGQAIPRMDLRKNGHQKCTNKLAEYEDLEEQGLLLKLPCKRVWRIVDAKTKYAYVLGKAIDNLTISEIRGIDKKGYYYSTAEKAEKALADMRKKVQE